MKIEKIIDKLARFSLRTSKKADTPVQIQTHSMIKSGQTSFYPSCIYIGYSSELPDSLAKPGVYNFLCIDDKEIPPFIIEQSNINLILLSPNTSLQELQEFVERIMIDEALLTSGMRRMTDTLYADKGLNVLVEEASEIFENPVFINDTAYKILAMSQKTSFADPTLEEEKELGYIHESNVDIMRKIKLFDQVHRSNGTLLFKRPDTYEEWLFRSVKLHGIIMADIGIESVNRPFRDSDYDLIEYFSKIVALDMEKSEFFKDNKGVMYNYFLEDLLSGNFKNPKAILQRTRFLNWNINSWFKIAVIVDNKNGLFEKKVHHLGTQMCHLFPDCRWTVHKKNFVALISRSDKNILSSDEREKFKNFLLSNDLSAGVSNPFSDLLETEFHYRQAYRAVEAGKLVFRNAGYYSYSDMMIYYIAKSLSEQNDLYDFFHPAIIALQKYDSENDTNLLETLKVYLTCPNDQAAVIKSLHIHRNTLFYRINRIKEITETDIDNGDERLKMQLYLKFLEYQKGR